MNNAGFFRYSFKRFKVKSGLVASFTCVIASSFITVAAWAENSVWTYEVNAPGFDKILMGDIKDGMAALEHDSRRGNPSATFLVFGAHHSGYSVPRNEKKAIEILQARFRNPVLEAEYSLGWSFYSGKAVDKDSRRALANLGRAAEKGHPGAQYFLGRMYFEEKPSKNNKKVALHWMQKAARSGSAYAFHYLTENFQKESEQKNLLLLKAAGVLGLSLAQEELHLLYLHGKKGVIQDYGQALFWGLIAAGQGRLVAQNNVGYMYIKGYGTKPNPREAIYWYRRAAEQGNAQAMSNLGLNYRYGSGVRKNYVLAHKWLNLAASHGNPRANTYRDSLARQMTPSQIATAQKLARQWRIKKNLREFRLKGGGTGFFINMSHMLVTNEHVTAKCAKVAVQYKNKIWDDVEILGARKDLDLALIRVNVPTGQVFEHGIAAMGPPEESSLGESVAVFGYPLAHILSSDGVFTTGYLNAHAGVRNNKEFIQISAQIQPGNSGSAVYDEKGRVIGVVSSSLRPVGGSIPQGVNFAAKSSALKKMIRAFHVANYGFYDKQTKNLDLKTRAQIAQRNSARILCYDH